MAMKKVAITMDEKTLKEVDRLVKKGIFSNRSRAIQQAVAEKVERALRSRLSQECELLDPQYEQAIADEGMSEEINEWPEY